MIVDNLNNLLTKYTVDCNKIKIITNDENNDNVKQFMKSNNIKKISSEIDDFDDSCIIIIWYKNYNQYDNSKIKFIDEYLKVKKIFILVVPLKFDFHNIVAKCSSSSFDVISWRNEMGEKYPEYVITIKND
ncbi:hypothetical protein QKU48_gp0885 [Fadolivirus algeromassiliense]|jgi:hypothetical protein|uniref:Uncharacterized protein n=1 Tax=Fadolivirus FV1/VV64 TaxID=3070911 RepID=A0A7D3QUQ8_9VIRU|nr:hypothetical protein QKU48_gp0885 [Fadolivirus algeromassiliense]QKF94343.1 hypothetical protein Fadolivirus_1_885 [Fadolivirus FV1/VV64]